MSTYPNLKNDPELLKIKTKNVKIKDLNNKTEKHDHENFLKLVKIDNEYYQQKSQSLNKKKVWYFFTEILLGSGSALTTSTMSIINPSIGIVLTSSTVLLTSIAILITKEYISEIKFCYTKQKARINVITLLCEKTLKTSMVDKEIIGKEAEELKKNYNH